MGKILATFLQSQKKAKLHYQNLKGVSMFLAGFIVGFVLVCLVYDIILRLVR